VIEAVNSVVSNATLVRAAAEQIDVRALAANPGRVQEVASIPQAPYISPYISMDHNYNKAVLQIRNSDTGDVITQFPSESRLRAAQASARLAAAQQQVTKQSSQMPTPAIGVTNHTEVSVPSISESAPAPTSDVGQAQIASAALATAQSSAQGISAGVSVLA
jgi:hypothetical protein